MLNSKVNVFLSDSLDSKSYSVCRQQANQFFLIMAGAYNVNICQTSMSIILF